jgi:DNA-directed RNA polymerases I, II, and III subunit RPABC2
MSSSGRGGAARGRSSSAHPHGEGHTSNQNNVQSRRAAATSSIIESARDVLAKYDPTKNKSNPVMSKYERSAVLGMRIEQLARGAQPFVDLPPEADKTPGAVAERELLERRLPFILKRTLPNGSHEYWRIEDLIVF